MNVRKCIFALAIFVITAYENQSLAEEGSWSYQLLAGLPTGVGAHYQLNENIGLQAQGGYIVRFGGAWQVDFDGTWTSERFVISDFHLYASGGLQRWVGNDGVWYAVRALPGIKKTIWDSYQLILAAGTSFYFYPEFAPELNAYAMIEVPL
jgi:hypothetical protein